MKNLIISKYYFKDHCTKQTLDKLQPLFDINNVNIDNCYITGTFQHKTTKIQYVNLIEYHENGKEVDFHLLEVNPNGTLTNITVFPGKEFFEVLMYLENLGKKREKEIK